MSIQVWLDDEEWELIQKRRNELGIDDSEYDDPPPPPDLVEAWCKHCRCCPQCSDYPCAGVQAGGFCDGMKCRCDDDYDDGDANWDEDWDEDL